MSAGEGTAAPADGVGRARSVIESIASRPWARPEVVLGAMVALFTAVFGWLNWMQQSNFGTFDFDLGVFDQEIWLAAHHLNPFLTIRGLNMWANHVNPIVYLLVPFYWLGAGAHFLLTLQTLVLALTAVPLWLLARDRLASPWLALGIPAAWLLYPAVEWMTWWPFHPEYFAAPALVFAYWFADRHRWAAYWVCVALALATKEDAALTVIALGLVLVLRRRVRTGLITMAVATGWFLLALEVIMRLATPTASPFFIDQYAAYGTSVWSIVGNAVRRPWLLWDAIVQRAHAHYYFQVLGPIAFLALLAPVTLILIVPGFLVNVANSQGYQMSIQFQYMAFIAPGLFIALVEGLARLRAPAWRRLRGPLVAALCGCALAGNVAWSPSPLDSRGYNGNWAEHASARTREITRLIGLVPAQASVAASYAVVPHLAHRDRIFTWPNPWIRSYYGVSETEPRLHPGVVDYLVLDLTANSDATTTLLNHLTGPGGAFRVVEERDGALLAVRRTRSRT